MKHFIGTIILLLPAAFLSGCKDGDTDDETRTATLRAGQYAQSQVQIERLRKARDTPTDWKAISKELTKTMPIVREIDSHCGTSYEDEISNAMKKCSAGKKPKVNQQIVAKGLQHVTVLAIERELDASRAETAAALFEGIRPTFTRRDRDFFKGTATLEKAADSAIAEIRSSAGTGDILSARRRLDDVIGRTYALCVLYEIQEIERLRHSDLDSCEVKHMEAKIFYRIIAKRIERHSPESHEQITNMLQSDYSKMNAAILETSLVTGLGGVPLRS
jgi:hypothetical protein